MGGIIFRGLLGGQSWGGGGIIGPFSSVSGHVRLQCRAEGIVCQEEIACSQQSLVFESARILLGLLRSLNK
jgi:hypothetical protein